MDLQLERYSEQFLENCHVHAVAARANYGFAPPVLYQPLASLKGFYRVMNYVNAKINVAPDGSPIFTRDIGYQEIYALNMRWP